MRCGPWIVLLATGLALSAGVVGALVTQYHSLGALGEMNTSPSREQIETAARIGIPPDASGLRARLDQAITKRTVFVRFSLPRTSLAPFLDASPFRAPLLEGATMPDLLVAEPRPDWFTPATGRTSLVGETARAAILVDTTDPVWWVVYVVARS
jgi:hypothetical protein